MCDGYDPPLKDNLPDLEDELLCEYVDGTMDPVVREVFEEYLDANPEIKEHVECLRDTRQLLCRYGCRCHAPRDLHDRLKRRITFDLSFHPVSFQWTVGDRLKGATMSSAFALLLVIGLAGGMSMLDDGDLRPTVMSATAVPSPDFRFSMDRAVRSPIRSSADFGARMSALGMASSPHVTTTIIQSDHPAPTADTSFALLLEQSASLP